MNAGSKLIMMANQIARNLSARGTDMAIEETRAHLLKFWSPKMRANLIRLATTPEGETLNDVARQAVDKLAIQKDENA